MIKKELVQSDIVGVFFGSLCAIHCLATPFLFAVQTCSIGSCAQGPIWWGFLDYLFIIISFFAVYHSSAHSNKEWTKYGLYFSWILLSALMVNEKIGCFDIDSLYKYLVAFALISIHLYNLKYCQNTSDVCLISN